MAKKYQYKIVPRLPNGMPDLPPGSWIGFNNLGQIGQDYLLQILVDEGAPLDTDTLAESEPGRPTLRATAFGAAQRTAFRARLLARWGRADLQEVFDQANLTNCRNLFDFVAGKLAGRPELLQMLEDGRSYVLASE